MKGVYFVWSINKKKEKSSNDVMKLVSNLQEKLVKILEKISIASIGKKPSLNIFVF
jgi:hypothetical protein